MPCCTGALFVLDVTSTLFPRRILLQDLADGYPWPRAVLLERVLLAISLVPFTSGYLNFIPVICFPGHAGCRRTKRWRVHNVHHLGVGVSNAPGGR